MTNRGRDHQPFESPAKNCRACAIYRSRLSSSLVLLSRPRPLDGGARYTPDWKGGGTILVSAPASRAIRAQLCKLSNKASYKSSCMNRCEVNEEQSPRHTLERSLHSFGFAHEPHQHIILFSHVMNNKIWIGSKSRTGGSSQASPSSSIFSKRSLTIGSINCIVCRTWDGILENIRATILCLKPLAQQSAKLDGGSRLEKLWKHGENAG
jgi:hypothetical protein